jgi:hypothetical protein
MSQVPGLAPSSGRQASCACGSAGLVPGGITGNEGLRLSPPRRRHWDKPPVPASATAHAPALRGRARCPSRTDSRTRNAIAAWGVVSTRRSWTSSSGASWSTSRQMPRCSAAALCSCEIACCSRRRRSCSRATRSAALARRESSVASRPSPGSSPEGPGRWASSRSALAAACSASRRWGTARWADRQVREPSYRSRSSRPSKMSFTVSRARNAMAACGVVSTRRSWVSSRGSRRLTRRWIARSSTRRLGP